MEDFVPFELAKKLKEKGFPQEPKNRCQYYEWDGLRKIHPLYTEMVWYESENKTYLYSAPTISQVLKWLREKKKIFILIDIRQDLSWFYEIWGIEISLYPLGCVPYQKNQSYELAAIAGIEYVIDNNLI